jgi:isoquinoline 1-oxidoreductase beta subunit
MTDIPQVALTSRRRFLKGAAATTSLTIGFHWPDGSLRARAHASAALEPNAFLRIGRDNIVTVVCKHIEFGQGPFTGVATILADELDADWAEVRVEAAPANVKLYGNHAWVAPRRALVGPPRWPTPGMSCATPAPKLARA